MLSLSKLALAKQRVLIRADLNVPVQNGRITSDFRLQAALPSIHSALEQQARVTIVSHLGRPKEGAGSQEQPEFSLEPVANWLRGALGRDLLLTEDWAQAVPDSPDTLVLLENIRFRLGETRNSPQLVEQLASLCDVFVMDAFGTAHRKHASTYGVIEKAPVACAGYLLETELSGLQQVRDNSARPLCVIVGGAKISTKLPLLQKLCTTADELIVGGGIANTLLAAKGQAIGNSLYDADALEKARVLLETGNFLLPVDVLVAQELGPYTRAIRKAVGDIGPNDRILDIGPETQTLFAEHIQSAGSLIWNGPMGLFEQSLFAAGTRTIGLAMANANAFSVAGGGDTLAAVEAFGITDQLSLISTGGGAFLEFMQTKSLPAVEALSKRTNETRV